MAALSCFAAAAGARAGDEAQPPPPSPSRAQGQPRGDLIRNALRVRSPDAAALNPGEEDALIAPGSIAPSPVKPGRQPQGGRNKEEEPDRAKGTQPTLLDIYLALEQQDKASQAGTGSGPGRTGSGTDIADPVKDLLPGDDLPPWLSVDAPGRPDADGAPPPGAFSPASLQPAQCPGGTQRAPVPARSAFPGDNPFMEFAMPAPARPSPAMPAPAAPQVRPPAATWAPPPPVQQAPARTDSAIRQEAEARRRKAEQTPQHNGF